MGGGEVVVHAARQFAITTTSSNRLLLKLDLKNAFNMIDRDRLLHAAAENLPKYVSCLDQCYRKPSQLMVGEHSIASKLEVQKGEPLGSLACCLVSQSLVSS